MQRTTAIIILGLGETSAHLQHLLNFGVKGLSTEVFRVGWKKYSHQPRTLDARLEELEKRVNLAKKNGHRVVLIGTSAGGPFALVAWSRFKTKVDKVVNVCGRLDLSEVSLAWPWRIFYRSINELKQDHLLFVTCATQAERILEQMTNEEKGKFLAMVPRYDQLVPIQSMSRRGWQIVNMNWFEHMTNILLAFTWYRKKLLEFISSE